MGVLLRMSLASFLLCSATACATVPREVRPHLEWSDSHNLATGNLGYIFSVPPAKAHEALEGVLREKFTISFLSVEKKSDLAEFKRYSKIITDFYRYEDQGKKYRKKCAAHVYVIPEYPAYAEVDISCVFDVYELGLIHGRGGIHNLFTQWWDWYPERGMYVAEDLLELVFKKLKLNESEVIRLNKKDFYTNEERLQLIKGEN